MATSHVSSFLTFWIFKEFSFPFSLVDNLVISDCWAVILIIFVLTHVWQASQAPHSKYLTNSPIFYSKSIYSQRTHDCSLSIWSMHCPLPVAFHICSLSLKPPKGVNRIFSYFVKNQDMVSNLGLPAFILLFVLIVITPRIRSFPGIGDVLPKFYQNLVVWC